MGRTPALGIGAAMTVIATTLLVHGLPGGPGLSAAPGSPDSGAAVAMGEAPDDAAGDAIGQDTLWLPPRERGTLDGFRTEGSAEVEILFGDTEQYKARIDRFYELGGLMESARRDYFRHVHGILAALGYNQVPPEPPLRRRCPDGVATPYRHAYQAGQRHRDLGAELEAHFEALIQLDRMGESTGLTPDYRWKVDKVREVYRTALRDYREMRTVMLGQIRTELRARRCSHDDLMRGTVSPQPAQPEPTGAPPPAGPGRPRDRDASDDPDEPSAAPTAAPVTIFIDNRRCEQGFVLLFDGTLAGRVPPRQRVAFQSRPGRRTLCLLAENTAPASTGDDAARDGSDPGAACGELGTVRSAYIHYGWSLVTHCQ